MKRQSRQHVSSLMKITANMDILYVIGRGSTWANNELKYSLRSLEKNCKNVGRIFIVGYCPDFIDKKKVTFIPVDDEQDCKHKNIMRCIEVAVEQSNISDDFLYSSDDHFYILPTDFDNYPFFRKPVEMPESYDNCNAYHKTLASTRMVFEAAGLTTYNFSWHGNTHFNKTLFNEPQFAAIRKISYYMQLGCEPSILMLNYWLSKRPFEITDRADRKFGKEVDRDGFMQGIEGRECISCASDVTKSYIRTYLAETFPDKSKYEL